MTDHGNSDNGPADGAADAEAGDEMFRVPEGRYRLDTEDDGQHIVSVSTPNVRLRITAGLSATRKSLRLVEPRTIFLDGAFDGPPFHDSERQIYSLDHHEGCIRSVTLATCEQAAVALVMGLPINEGRWTLVINEPDLDAILACWVLMNHIDLLKDDCALLKSVMPLLKVEGNIDSYGFGKEFLSGLEPDPYQFWQGKLDSLMLPIKTLKSEGRWQAAEFDDLVLSILDAFDRLLIPREMIIQSLEFQEVGRVRLRGRRIAILCRSNHGIYVVEKRLADRYGKMLGVIVLEQDDGRFTIRRSDGFGVAPLRELYKRLNRVDPAVGTSRKSANRWGGADDIGGSPRETGSGLTGREVLMQVEKVYGEPPTLWKKLSALFPRQDN